MTRDTLTANRDYYVATTGSDSNDGLTSAAAFATLQHAADTIHNTLDLDGFGVTVNVAAGTYNGGFRLDGGCVGLRNHSSIYIIGDINTPSNVIVNCGSDRAFFANDGGKFQVGGFKVSGNGGASGGMGLRSEFPGSMIYCCDKMEYGTLGCAISAENDGFLFAISPSYTISGNQYYHVCAIQGGHVTNRNSAVTLTGNPAWGGGFAIADRQALLEAFSLTFSGSATGTRYVADGNSTIFTWGGGANYFPGSVAGYVQSGGQYF